ncbi:gamma carbonic anhydrase family protein [Microbacterium sp. gxy059]|uniref:gamma carbonic anhydrase family protein n=1 Tax=Microbacterium sp. gxy059 TaxID=2957199 RepID=UPI003D97A30A
MMIDPSSTVRAIGGLSPAVAETAFVAAGARIVGDVSLGERSSVWYNAVLRGDVNGIRVGAGSNLQDGVAVHVDAAHPCRIGADVSIGHGAVVHGCEIGDGSLIGMGAVVLSGAVIGEETLVAAGAVVREGERIPPRSLVAGVPAKTRRPLTDEEIAGLRDNASRYVGYREEHAAALP